jgi:hypothetical protein
MLNGGWVSVEGHMNVGDITLFKYDVTHNVSLVDEDKVLDLSSEKGRCTMVIPFRLKRRIK